MADRRVVVCNVLCFFVSMHCHTSLKTLNMVLTDFYSVDELAADKLLLLEDIDSLSLPTKRHQVPLRRDGDGRLARQVDDLLITFMDEQKALDQAYSLHRQTTDRSIPS